MRSFVSVYDFPRSTQKSITACCFVVNSDFVFFDTSSHSSHQLVTACHWHSICCVVPPFLNARCIIFSYFSTFYYGFCEHGHITFQLTLVLQISSLSRKKNPVSNFALSFYCMNGSIEGRCTNY